MDISWVQEQFGKAVAAVKARDVNKALSILDRIVLEVPTFTPAWNQRGSILETVGNHLDAMLNFEKVIQIAPYDATGYVNRGSSLLSMGRYKAAISDFDAALEHDPKLPQAWNNKGITYRRLCMIDEARKCFLEALRYDPNYSDARLGLSMCLLELQQFEQGWLEFEYRFGSEQMPSRNMKQPRWHGEQAKKDDDVLLIWGEQGFGDVFQFARYVKHAKALWRGKICVEVRLPAYRIMQDVEGVSSVVVLGEGIPKNVTYQIPMMSVPAIVGTALGFEGPYLKAREDLRANWPSLLKQLPLGARVGLCWAGMNREENVTASAIDGRRSLSLDALAPVARVKGIVWVSLQKGEPAGQVKAPPAGMLIADLMSEVQDWADTAALISHLDLVITVDTAVAHLAAGLGKPTWMLSRFDGCWRWFGDRPDSPWYPTMRQFRQKTEGDWGPVLEEVWSELQMFMTQKQRNRAA